MSTPVKQFEKIRSGFYRGMDSFDFKNTLGINIRAYGMELKKMTSAKSHDNQIYEAIIIGGKQDHKLTITIAPNDLFFFTLQSFNISAGQWYPAMIKNALSIEDWNRIFPKIIEEMK